MKYFCFLFIILNISFTQKESLYHYEFPIELVELVGNIGYEPVYGDRFPIINPYGSYGSPYIFDFLLNNEIENSVLFLCRKRNKNYKNVKESIFSLIYNYDYALILAVKYAKDKKYSILNILDRGIGLKGINLYNGAFGYDKDMSYFTKVTDRKIKGPKNKKPINSIIISSDSASLILTYYNNDWYEYSEIDF